VIAEELTLDPEEESIPHLRVFDAGGVFNIKEKEPTRFSEKNRR
jgi:hypothetical protein